MKVIANAKDPKFSNTKVEIYQRIISKVDFVLNYIVNVNNFG